MSAVKVGQTLYLPPRHGRSDYTEYKVLSIGRKWIALSGDRRCSIDRLLLDCGGYTPPQLYIDKDVHANEVRVSSAWIKFSRDVSGCRPAGVTLDSIRKARAVLGIVAEDDQ